MEMEIKMEKLSITENPRSAGGVQIIRPVNHKYEMRLENLMKICQDNDTIMEDHNVVIVSIAGAFRKGKSFLMNFFLKYLNAQVKF